MRGKMPAAIARGDNSAISRSKRERALSISASVSTSSAN